MQQAWGRKAGASSGGKRHRQRLESTHPSFLEHLLQPTAASTGSRAGGLRTSRQGVRRSLKAPTGAEGLAGPALGPGAVLRGGHSDTDGQGVGLGSPVEGKVGRWAGR